MRVIFLTVLLATLCASAGPRTLVLATGDCRDFDVLDVTTALSNDLATRLSPDALDPNLALEKLRPAPTSTLDAVRHALEAAQAQFYDGKHTGALEGARAASKDLERLPPSAETWKLYAQSLVLQGLVLRALNDKNGSNDAWRKVLARQSDYALDRDLYTPATLQQFEQVRKENAKTARLELWVRSTVPGAEVMIDGHPVGKAPWHQGLMPGSYRISLMSGEQRSFIHEVQLNKAAELQVDVAFEASVQPRRPLCVAADGKTAIDQAIRVAALAGADQAMVVRNESPAGEAGFVSVTVVDVKRGATLRVGGMKVAQAHTAQGSASLADFLVTGKSAPPVVSLDGSTSAAAAIAQSAPVPPPPPIVSAAEAKTSGWRLTSYALMAAGVVAAGVGIAVYAGGGSNRSQLSGLLDPNGNLPPRGSAAYQQALSLNSAGQSNQTLSLALGLGGAVVAAAGAMLFFLMPAQEEAHVALGFGRDSAWVGFTGAF